MENKLKNNKEYYIYIIRCEDNSLYTGITTDLDRRMKEHLEKGKKGAKYTSSHNVKKIEIVWKTKDKIRASKLEYHIKTLKKIQKEELIEDPIKLNEFLSDKIEYQEYVHIKLSKLLI
ncbi:MAG: GIY-YIG nuclease family protein [Clostridia bacterium]|nr:GIY-YIG nuclease family protein [Clostridia bacterium]